MNAWRVGANDEALAHCLRLIADDPGNADALHLAGVLNFERDRECARTLLNRARNVHETPSILVDLARTYEDGEPLTAQALLERALELDELFPYALNNLANLHTARGEDAPALVLFERLTKVHPGFAPGQLNYGSLLLTRSLPARAEGPLRRAIELNADNIDAWVNLAMALSGLNRHTEALTLLEQARKLWPESAAIFQSLAVQQFNLGRFDEAHASIACAVGLNPQDARVWNSLGNVLYVLGRPDEARLAFAYAVRLQPDFAEAHCNLGNVLAAYGESEAAISCYRRALECEPGNPVAGSAFAYLLEFTTEDAAMIRAAAETYSARHEVALLAQPVSHANNPDPARRLRIGYVSPDFRRHCQMLFTTPLFAHHDHHAFEIVCYSTVVKPDEVTEHLASYADLWRDVREFDDERFATQIRDDGIDILVDLTMHMAGARRLVFARRPAPVQVAWLAYPGTTGSPAIGWRLTDPWLDPSAVSGEETPDALAAYTERSLRLPDTFWCYDALDSDAEINTLPALAAGHVTFGCLNNPFKLSNTTLDLWSGIFAALPDSRLVLLAPAGTARERITARLAARGMDASRVRFVGTQARSAYLRTYGQIDIALDTLPANGHTTSLDAFWMGVPVPTRVGRAVAGRAGLSLLSNLGLQGLAAYSDADYVRIVVELARDLPRLAALRGDLRARMQASALTDGRRFARGMEAAYRLMWRVWCDEALSHDSYQSRNASTRDQAH